MPICEIAKGEKELDLKEFWHVGLDLPADHRLATQQPNNVWPKEVEGFRAAYDRLFAEFDRVGARLLSGIARYLGLAPDFFDDTVKDGNSVMRLLHYPPVEAPARGIRAEAHEDINTITLLLGAEEAGLEKIGRDGSWLPGSPPPGAMEVTSGDMLQRRTNDRLPPKIGRASWRGRGWKNESISGGA